MTVIRPNSISGITSITAQANEINVFRSNGLIAGLNLNGVNFNTTAGISTLAALKVTGNVDIAGVLTYQDVTNVDSLGIGTFRTGINVSGGQLDVGSSIKLGNAGVITATSFVGSGANLTNLPAQVNITGNADNRVITGGSGVNLNAEASLTFDGQALTLTSGYLSVRQGALPQVDIQHSTTNSYSRLYMSQSSGSGGYFAINKLGTVDAGYTGGANAVQFWSSAAAPMLFATSNTEAFRIDGNGHARFGSSGDTSDSNWSDSTFGNTEVSIDGGGGYGVLHLRGDGSGNTNTRFSMGVGDDKFYMCYDDVDSRHNITVDGSGNVGINQGNPTDKLHVNGTTNFMGNSYIGGDLFMYGSSYTKGIYLGGSNAVNKLDHYQTGQWVPEVIDDNGSNYSINYTANETRYVRIGNLVYCYYNIQNVEGGSKTGSLRLRGWPFTCFGFQVGGSFWVDHSSPSAGLGDIVGGTHYINRVSGNNVVYFVKPTDKSGMGYASSRYLSHGQWSYGRWIYGSFTYHISGS